MDQLYEGCDGELLLFDQTKGPYVNEEGFEFELTLSVDLSVILCGGLESLSHLCSFLNSQP